MNVALLRERARLAWQYFEAKGKKRKRIGKAIDRLTKQIEAKRE